MSAAPEFDASGIPVGGDCEAIHPTTGSGCIEPAGHEGPHYAMGTMRMQLFGDMLTSGEATP